MVSVAIPAAAATAYANASASVTVCLLSPIDPLVAVSELDVEAAFADALATWGAHVSSHGRTGVA